MNNPTNEVMNIKELANYLKISKSTLYKLVREGKIPCQKIGKHWRFHKETIDQWLGNKNIGKSDDTNDTIEEDNSTD